MSQINSIKIDQLRINIPYSNTFSSSYSDIPKPVAVVDKIFNFCDIFQEHSLSYGHNGYTTSYNLGTGTDGGTISIMWNESRVDMGILVDFTASGKILYEELSKIHGIKVNWKEIIQTVYEDYKGHLSRIDVAVDLIDYNFSVSDIYRRLKSKKSFFLNSLGNKIDNKRFKIVGNTDDVQTLYVGSRKSDNFLRIYNKKLEQSRPNGVYRNIAYTCHDWIRIEAEFKHRGSKNLGYCISRLKDRNINSYLVAYLLQCWSLVDNKEWQDDE